MELQKMLDRGYGLYIINELLSLKIHDNSIELVIAELPDYPAPVYIPLESRSIQGIFEEAYDFTTQYLAGYLDVNCKALRYRLTGIIE